MNKLITVVTFAALAPIAMVAAEAVPNVYVVGLAAKVNDGALECSYKLNTSATVAINIVKEDGTIEKTYTENIPGEKGPNSCSLSLDGVVAGNYTLRLTATGTSTANQTEAWASPYTDGDMYGYSRARGVTVDNDPESPFCGNMYIAAAAGSDPKNYNYRGIFIYDYQQEVLNPSLVNGYLGGIKWNGRSSPLRVSVDESHKVVISDWGNAQFAVSTMNPANPEANFNILLAGSADGITTNTCVSSAAIVGTGSEQILYTIDQSYNGAAHILVYNIGDRTSPWSSAPSKDFGNLGGLLDRSAEEIIGCIIPDKKGNFWVSQQAKPFLMHMTAEGEVDYQMPGDMLANANKGAIATNYDGSKLLFGSFDKVYVFEVNFAETGIELTESAQVTVPVRNNLWQVAIDPGENIYAVGQRDVGEGAKTGIAIMALPKEDNSYAATMPFNYEGTSAIADVDAEGKLVYRDGVIRSAVPAVVYTAAGVKVAEGTEIAADALAGGVYIVRAGAEILKIVR